MRFLTHPSGREVAVRAVGTAESVETPDPLTVHMIDSIYRDVETLFHGAELTASDFRVLRHRLWLCREHMCALPLPENLRDKTPEWYKRVG
jgi:hypothetical protein